MSTEKIDEDKIYAAISYLWLLFLVPLVLKKNSEFVMYHTKQGLVLFIAGLFVTFFSWIPLLGWFLGMILGLIIGILAFLGILNALSGKKWEMPFLGYYAKKIKI